MSTFSKTADCSDCQLKSNLFCYMTDEQLAKVNEDRREVTFEPGETIFKFGGPLTHILCLTSGMVKAYLEASGGKRVLLDIITPVKLIGGPGFLTDGRNHLTITALERTTACFISVEDYKEVMLQNAEFSMEMVKYLNRIIIKYLDRINSLTHKHMSGKIAETLLHLSDDIYQNKIFDTLLSRQDLADMSAMTKESVIRILKELNESGVIFSDNNHFEILDKIRLAKISETG